MLIAIHAAFSTAMYLGGAAVFEYPTDPVSWDLAVFFMILASPLYFIYSDARSVPLLHIDPLASITYEALDGRGFASNENSV
ncbi:MAG: hypothetical protein ACU85E_06575 [Gammaproteobacteria bacterium]